MTQLSILFQTLLMITDLLNCMRLFRALLISGTAQGAEVDYGLLIADEPAQALPPRRNSEILISAHKSLLINGRWKEREEDKAYENFGGKREAKYLYS